MEIWSSDVDGHGERSRGEAGDVETRRWTGVRQRPDEREASRETDTGSVGVGKTGGGKLGRRGMEKDKDETGRGEKKQRKGEFKEKGR